MKTIKQGDSYPLRMAIALNGQLIDDSTIYSVDTVEICLRDICKEYHSDGSGEISYEDGVFSFPLTQKESFALRSGKVDMDVRIKTINGWVQGLQKIERVDVAAAISRKEL